MVELLIAIMIMATVCGIVGSLMLGYVRMFNETSDHSVAKRRAVDVFNVLNVPIQNAGLGIPVDDTGWYFSWPGGSGVSFATDTPVASWRGPLDVRDTRDFLKDSARGDVLQVIYSTATGWKTQNLLEMEPFDGTIVPKPSSLPYPKSITLASDYLTFAVNAAPGANELTLGTPDDARGFYTTPDAYSIPMYFSEYSVPDKKAKICGRPRFYSVSSDIPIATGEISPYSDLHRIYAIAAYVDSKSVFHAAEIAATDIGPLVASDRSDIRVTKATGLRVDGVKAIRFERGGDYKTLTVWVLAEGDIIDQARNDRTKTRASIRSRWPEITDWDEAIYYEDYSMTWRTRSYAARQGENDG